MDIETIRQELEFNTGTYPIRAVRAAIEQREAMTPVLLAALQDAAESIEEIDRKPTYTLHLYAMYLLAQFREKAAYPLLVKFFSTPGDLSMETTGDFVTEDLNRVLASVCHTELEPIKRLIEDPAVNEYVRSACLKTLTVLVAEKQLSREEVIDYLRTLFQGKLERKPDFIWSALVSTSCRLYPQELLSDIERAFENGLVELSYISMDSVRKALAEGKERVLQKNMQRHRGLIKDVIAETKWWACFDKDEESLPKTSQRKVERKKIGRNDPCPCGSGKKFKKCCLN